MKKTLLFLFLLLLAPLLIGCGSLYAQRREVEQLQVMETLGLDPAPGGRVQAQGLHHLQLLHLPPLGVEGAAADQQRRQKQ